MTSPRDRSAPERMRRPTLPPDLRPTRRAGVVPTLPGLLLVAGAAAASMVLADLLVSATGAAVSPLVVALGIGAVLGTLRAVPRAAAPGVAWAGKHVLRAGIVLLGLQLSLGQLAGLGWRGVTVVLVTVICTFLLTLRLGRWMGVDPLTRLYVATGFSICGAAAIAAMSATVGGARGPAGRAVPGRGATEPGATVDGDAGPDVPGDGDAVGTALALVTLYGTLAVLVLPWVVSALGLSDAQAGLFIGSSVQEVGQVVAAAGAVSAPALAAATVAKLARVVLLAPLTALVAAHGRRTARAVGSVRSCDDDTVDGPSGTVDGPAGTDRGPAAAGARRAAPLVPAFVLAFLGAVLVRSTGVLPDALLSAADVLQRVLLTAAMVALGTSVDLRRLVRSGGRSLGLGAVATVVAAGVALLGTLLLA
ncbi:putative sulfate exporter family transporter [Sanguibacter sp. 4.1]|uniref:Sulfate exporter family transporter n=1 Tax=Sanguibacter biliveldensis TaxID=3030830 RepID=A0AAF1C3W6_9MICO|nr:putative sulfate exporter family transporter [Sanguibacter sp. 4.1]WPF83419.1 putative sulfate exporter family transporter [Sanguibacter sp. 4.1]